MTSKMSVSNIQFPDFIFDQSASCASVDPELFFPQEVEISPGKIVSKYTDIAAAKKVCAGCPIKWECLDFGLKNAEMGIWGGLTESQRDTMRKLKGIVPNKRLPTPMPR